MALKTLCTTSKSLSPFPPPCSPSCKPVRQLLTANRTAPRPIHFVPVTYISLDPLISAARIAPASLPVSTDDLPNLDEGLGAKRTMLSGTIPGAPRSSCEVGTSESGE